MNIAIETGLETDIVESLSNIFSASPDLNEVLIFGSRAKGNFSAGSDIDMAVRGKNVSLDAVLDMMSEIDKLGLLYKVDLHRLEEITDADLLDHIRRVGKVLWRRES